MQEDVLEPSVADFADTPLAQGKPRCITLILNNKAFYENYVHKYIHP